MLLQNRMSTMTSPISSPRSDGNPNSPPVPPRPRSTPRSPTIKQTGNALPHPIPTLVLTPPAAVASMTVVKPAPPSPPSLPPPRAPPPPSQDVVPNTTPPAPPAAPPPPPPPHATLSKVPSIHMPVESPDVPATTASSRNLTAVNSPADLLSPNHHQSVPGSFSRAISEPIPFTRARSEPTSSSPTDVPVVNKTSMPTARQGSTRRTSLRSSRVQAHLNLAKEFAKAGKYANAVSELDEALALRPDLNDNVSFHANRGSYNFHAGAFADAVNDFRAAVALDDKTASIHYNLGNSLLSLSSYQEAMIAFTHAVELDPDLTEAHALNARAKFRLNDFVGAIESAEAAIALTPSHRMAHDFRVRSLDALGKHVELVHATRALMASFPNIDGITQKRRVALGHLLALAAPKIPLTSQELRIGAARDAVQLVSDYTTNMALATVSPKDKARASKAAAQFSLEHGIALVEAGRFKEAIHYLKRSLRLVGEEPPTLYYMGVALQNSLGDSGDVEKAAKLDIAKECYDACLRLDASHVQARKALEDMGVKPPPFIPPLLKKGSSTRSGRLDLPPGENVKNVVFVEEPVVVVAVPGPSVSKPAAAAVSPPPPPPTIKIENNGNDNNTVTSLISPSGLKVKRKLAELGVVSGAQAVTVAASHMPPPAAKEIFARSVSSPTLAVTPPTATPAPSQISRSASGSSLIPSPTDQSPSSAGSGSGPMSPTSPSSSFWQGNNGSRFSVSGTWEKTKTRLRTMGVLSGAAAIRKSKEMPPEEAKELAVMARRSTDEDRGEDETVVPPSLVGSEQIPSKIEPTPQPPPPRVELPVIHTPISNSPREMANKVAKQTPQPTIPVSSPIVPQSARTSTPKPPPLPPRPKSLSGTTPLRKTTTPSPSPSKVTTSSASKPSPVTVDSKPSSADSPPLTPSKKNKFVKQVSAPAALLDTTPEPATSGNGSVTSKRQPAKAKNGGMDLRAIESFPKSSKLKPVTNIQDKTTPVAHRTDDLLSNLQFFNKERLKHVSPPPPQSGSRGSNEFEHPLRAELARFTSERKLRPVEDRIRMETPSPGPGARPFVSGGIADLLLSKLATISLAVDGTDEWSDDEDARAVWDD